MACAVEERLMTGGCTGKEVLRVEFFQHKAGAFANVNSTP